MTDRKSSKHRLFFYLIWPVAGFFNAVLMTADNEMGIAYFNAKHPNGPGLGSFTGILGFISILVLSIFGLLQITHGFRKKSRGIRVGIATILFAAPFFFALERSGILAGLGGMLYNFSGYGSLDFYYSPVFYVGLLIASWLFGVTRNLTPLSP